jgi:hypothetical protein
MLWARGRELNATFNNISVISYGRMVVGFTISYAITAYHQ